MPTGVVQAFPCFTPVPCQGVQAFFVGRAANWLGKDHAVLEALHKAGHKYLKLLFVLALAGSSTLFFIGTAIPKPPGLVIIMVGGVLGVAIEWAYFTVSCDLTESITRGHKGGVVLNLLYTLAGGVASWFLFSATR